jgi:carboxypeptidase C (cathepsin A)
MQRLVTFAAALLLAACGGGGGGGSSGSNPGPGTVTGFTDNVTYSSGLSSALPSADEITAVTKHQLVLGGATLNYTATAGHLTARTLVSGDAEASFFYVAYTLDGRDPATRPVTFFYNGGPGSATVWLHLGSFGPKRLVASAPSTTVPTPFPLVDNPESLLDVSDLVYVDAIGSGFSEAIAPNNNGTFWGVDADAAVFRDFVMRYIAVNGRAASPKFLFGESYGTTRSAVLANLLESAGVTLKGVVLQSSVLNYNSNCGLFAKVTISCAGYLPSYGAVGAWLNLDNPNPAPADLPAFVAQMRSFASTQYDPAARAFLASKTAPAPALVAQLVATTGMAAGNWQAHFNMDETYFHDNLVPGTVIGLYDGRVTAPAGSALASEDDPSSTFITPSFAQAIVSYLASDLHYTNPSSYVLLGNAIRSWNFFHGGNPAPDVVPDLAAALTLNPKLKVLSLNGYHDLVTPFYTTEMDLARFGTASSNITTRFYVGGHMTYLDDTSRPLEKADLAQFYQGALAATAAAAAAPGAPASAAVETPAPARSAMPPAIMEGPLRGPWLPPELRNVTPAPPTRGEELRLQIEGKLRQGFDAADTRGAGAITRDEARAAGLGFVVNHFDAIDQRRAGAVRFEDLQRFLREQ